MAILPPAYREALAEVNFIRDMHGLTPVATLGGNTPITSRLRTTTRENSCPIARALWDVDPEVQVGMANEIQFPGLTVIDEDALSDAQGEEWNQVRDELEYAITSALEDAGVGNFGIGCLQARIDGLVAEAMDWVEIDYEAAPEDYETTTEYDLPPTVQRLIETFDVACGYPHNEHGTPEGSPYSPVRFHR